MRRYLVSIPIVGSWSVEVVATSAVSAVDEAWRKYNEHGHGCGEIEWETVSSIMTGNVCHAPLTDIQVLRCRDGKGGGT